MPAHLARFHKDVNLAFMSSQVIVPVQRVVLVNFTPFAGRRRSLQFHGHYQWFLHITEEA